MYYDPEIFKIQTNNVLPKKGRILIAEPFLPGNYFNRAVILLVAFSKKGTVGFIINKQIDLQVQDYIEDFPDFNAQVYMGGPVSTDSIYFIHTRGDIIPGSIQVLDNLYWGGDFEELKKLIGLGLIQSNEVRFFLGYSGWDAGQLDREIKENSWLVNNVDSTTVMRHLNMSSWVDFVKQVGKPYSLWVNYPENPSLN
ncbi:MAG TPA: transcriptional regulator [Prolixibacteraceae bacterium]|nr:transcriptional regulator [Prolixibacteraceae bacterium]